MTKKQLENVKKFFENKRNRVRLLELLKAGTFVEFNEDFGYMYSIKIGEMQNMDLMLNVSMMNGNFTIHEVYFQVIPGVVGMDVKII